MTAKAYLADLTHTAQGIALNAFPLGIGCIAAYALKHLQDQVDISLFRFPERLAEQVLRDPPDVIGFTNYMWNLDLSYSLAREFKARFPNIVVVFGGPNYDSSEGKIREFFRRYPAIDFYVYKEGERPFLELMRRLMEHDFNVDDVKATNPLSCHCLREGEVVQGDILERVRDLDEIPSPYTSGLMDEFFDGNLVPMIQTNRGCPFACTFCVEGITYYNKLNKKTNDRVGEELQYIARRVKGTPDLHICDSNFGMYHQDIEVCREIAKVQEQFEWPKYIHVATGKNQKERVLQAADIIHGALRLSAAVQSMDDGVLKNIKRNNISTGEIIEVVHKGNEVGSNTYSEIILCLPGDTKEAHFNTIKSMVEASLNFLRIHTLMMLPGTELAEPETRARYEMVTKFRVLPRCFGSYHIGESIFRSAEIEEVCVSNNTMTQEEYLDCRLMDLFVELFYNDGILEEVVGLLKLFDISVFDWLKYLNDHCDQFPEEVINLFAEFRRETADELWDSEEDLAAFTKNEETINRYIGGEYGSNLIFKYKSLTLFHHFDRVNEAVFSLTKEMLESRGLLLKELWLRLYLEDLQAFSSARKDSVLNTGLTNTHRFQYDLKGMQDAGFRADPAEYRVAGGISINFSHNEDQAEYIHSYLEMYGDSVIGLSRILSKIYVKKIYRTAAYIGLEPGPVVDEGQQQELQSEVEARAHIHFA